MHFAKLRALLKCKRFLVLRFLFVLCLKKQYIETLRIKDLRTDVFLQRIREWKISGDNNLHQRIFYFSSPFFVNTQAEMLIPSDPHSSLSFTQWGVTWYIQLPLMRILYFLLLPSADSPLRRWNWVYSFSNRFDSAISDPSGLPSTYTADFWIEFVRRRSRFQRGFVCIGDRFLTAFNTLKRMSLGLDCRETSITSIMVVISLSLIQNNQEICLSSIVRKCKMLGNKNSFELHFCIYSILINQLAMLIIKY